MHLLFFVCSFMYFSGTRPWLTYGTWVRPWDQEFIVLVSALSILFLNPWDFYPGRAICKYTSCSNSNNDKILLNFLIFNRTGELAWPVENTIIISFGDLLRDRNLPQMWHGPGHPRFSVAGLLFTPVLWILDRTYESSSPRSPTYSLIGDTSTHGFFQTGYSGPRVEDLSMISSSRSPWGILDLVMSPKHT